MPLDTGLNTTPETGDMLARVETLQQKRASLHALMLATAEHISRTPGGSAEIEIQQLQAKLIDLQRQMDSVNAASASMNKAMESITKFSSGY